MAIIRTNLACSTESTATCTATETAAPTQSNRNEIPAVCVDYIDHGERETPWGYKPQASLVFETDAHGKPKWLTRTYNNYAYSKSALALDIKNWLGTDIAGDDEGWDLANCVGRQATLKIKEVLSKAGNVYRKIESVNPCGAEQVQASGTYQRLDQEI